MKKIFAALLLTVLAGCSSDSSATAVTASVDNSVQFDQALHDKLPLSVRNTKTLRFVTDASYAPMEQFAPDGRTIVGFEPDLADALGRVLGVKIQIVNGTFQTGIDQVVNGTYDGMLSAVTDTPAREKKADFVDYFSAGTSIVVQRGNPGGITEIDNLCGRMLAVEQGTTQAELAVRSQKVCGDRPIQINQTKTHADALLQLRTGRAVAVLDDYPAASHLASDSRTSNNFQLASAAQYEPGLFGIPVAKGNVQLRDALKAAMDRVISSGVYADLLTRWGLSDGAVKSATLNGGR
jgi:polar amino acid transport system substrate-binding protein